MNNHFKTTEVRIIRNLLPYKTDFQIACLLKKPVEEITALISKMRNLPSRPGEGGKEAKHKFKSSKPRGRRKKENKPVEEKFLFEEPFKSLKAPKKSKIRSSDKKTMRQSKKPTREIPKPRLHVSEEKRMLERKQKLQRGMYKTRPLDLTGTIPVRLNARTTVWVKPGTDIEKLKTQLRIA